MSADIPIGYVQAMRGLVCDVALTGDAPDIKEVLTPIDNPEVVLEVQSIINPYTVRCINVLGSSEVYQGVQVVRTGTTLSVPEGSAVLGRILNAMGQPVDGGGPIERSEEHTSELQSQ